MLLGETYVTCFLFTLSLVPNPQCKQHYRLLRHATKHTQPGKLHTDVEQQTVYWLVLLTSCITVSGLDSGPVLGT